MYRTEGNLSRVVLTCRWASLVTARLYVKEAQQALASNQFSEEKKAAIVLGVEAFEHVMDV